MVSKIQRILFALKNDLNMHSILKLYILPNFIRTFAEIRFEHKNSLKILIVKKIELLPNFIVDRNKGIFEYLLLHEEMICA